MASVTALDDATLAAEAVAASFGSDAHDLGRSSRAASVASGAGATGRGTASGSSGGGGGAGAGTAATSTDAAATRKMTPQERRLRICEEIKATETAYLQSLLIVQSGFLEPLRHRVKQGDTVLTERAMVTLFGNIDDLVRVNKELLTQLRVRMETAEWQEKRECIGDIFLKISPFLKLYSVYVSNYDKAVQVLVEQTKSNAVFAAFLKERTAAPECQGLSLLAYLIMPVQRIPRYKLLCEDLLKYTPEDHADHLNLSKAFTIIEDVANYVNETLRQQMYAAKIVAIQKSITGLQESLVVPGRRYVRDGVLLKACRKSNKPRAFFLFSDALFYASVSGQQGSELSYTFHRKIMLDGVRAVPRDDTEQYQHSFVIISTEKSFTVFAENAGEKEAWLNDLNNTATLYRKNRSTLKIDGESTARLSAFGGKTVDKAAASEMDALPEDVLKRIAQIRDAFVAPVWVPDNEVSACFNCKAEFTVVRRRHHCRICGRVACGQCCPKRPAPWLSSEPIRVCEPCWPSVRVELPENQSQAGSRRSVMSKFRTLSQHFSRAPIITATDGVLSEFEDEDDGTRGTTDGGVRRSQVAHADADDVPVSKPPPAPTAAKIRSLAARGAPLGDGPSDDASLSEAMTQPLHIVTNRPGTPEVASSPPKSPVLVDSMKQKSTRKSAALDGAQAAAPSLSTTKFWWQSRGSFFKPKNVVQKAAEMLAESDEEDDDEDDADDSGDDDSIAVMRKLEQTRSKIGAVLQAQRSVSPTGRAARPAVAPGETSPRPKAITSEDDLVSTSHRLGDFAATPPAKTVITRRRRSASCPELLEPTPDEDEMRSFRGSANYSAVVDSVKRSAFAAPETVAFATQPGEDSDLSLWKVKMSGWLHKKGVINVSWKRRWFVLGIMQGAHVPITMARLFYYKSEQTTTLAGSIDIKDVISVVTDRADETRADDQPAVLLRLITPQRIFFLGAETAAVCDDWNRAIQATMHGMSLAKAALSGPAPAVPAPADAASDCRTLVKRGYLTKQGNRYKSWKTRWFELSDRMLSYFKDKEAATSNQLPLGTVLLSACQSVLDGFEHTHMANSFSLATTDRTYFMVAQSSQDRDDWIIVLRQAVKNAHAQASASAPPEVVPSGRVRSRSIEQSSGGQFYSAA